MMYPDSFFWWVGGIMVMIGVLGLIFLLATYVDLKANKRKPPKDEEDDDG